MGLAYGLPSVLSCVNSFGDGGGILTACSPEGIVLAACITLNH
jgi:hypothetical protein